MPYLFQRQTAFQFGLNTRELCFWRWWTGPLAIPNFWFQLLVFSALDLYYHGWKNNNYWVCSSIFIFFELISVVVQRVNLVFAAQYGFVDDDWPQICVYLCNFWITRVFPWFTKIMVIKLSVAQNLWKSVVTECQAKCGKYMSPKYGERCHCGDFCRIWLEIPILWWSLQDMIQTPMMWQSL